MVEATFFAEYVPARRESVQTHRVSVRVFGKRYIAFCYKCGELASFDNMDDAKWKAAYHDGS